MKCRRIEDKPEGFTENKGQTYINQSIGSLPVSIGYKLGFLNLYGPREPALRQRQNKRQGMDWAQGNGMDCGGSSLMVCCLLVGQIMLKSLLE